MNNPWLFLYMCKTEHTILLLKVFLLDYFVFVDDFMNKFCIFAIRIKKIDN